MVEEKQKSEKKRREAVKRRWKRLPGNVLRSVCVRVLVLCCGWVYTLLPLPRILTKHNYFFFFFFFFFFVSFLLRYWPYGKSLEGLRVHRIASGRNHMAFIVGTPFILSGNGGSNGGKSSGGGGHDSHDSGRETQKGGQGTSTSATAREEKGVLAHTMSIGTP